MAEQTDHDILIGLQAVVADIDSKVDCLMGAYQGNGEPGIKVRLDRMEQWKEGVDTILRYVGVPLTVSMVLSSLALIWGLVTNRIELIIH